MRNEQAEIFSRLGRWRHFPNYQLERRADIFFSIYLVEYFQNLLKPTLQDIVIPEFPIKRDLVWKAPPSQKSVKVDYVLFAQDHSLVLFVELKTAIASRREEQDNYLDISAKRPFAEILQGVKEISIHTKYKQKYFHLLSDLSQAGFLTLPSDLESFLFPRVKRGVRRVLEQIQILPHSPQTAVYYLQPDYYGQASNVISFNDFANFISKYDDEFTRLFTSSLGDWTAEAGSIPPRPSD